LAAPLFAQALQLLAIHAAIAVAISLAEMALQPGVNLGFAAIDAAIAVAVGLLKEARGALASRGLGWGEIFWSEVAALAAVETLEMALEIGLAACAADRSAVPPPSEPRQQSSGPG
jgi:hypothetical protein